MIHLVDLDSSKIVLELMLNLMVEVGALAGLKSLMNFLPQILNSYRDLRWLVFLYF